MCKQSNQQNAQCKMESGTMKIETLRRGSGLPLLSLLSLMSLSAFAIPVMPYGTYLVKGSFKGDYNTVMRDFGEAKVRAQRADGTVIAESTVRSADSEGVNFLLSIPVASASTAKSCKVGESLNCVLTTQEGALDVPNSLKVASPITVGKVTFNCTEVKSYTNTTDGAVVEIPTAYIAEAQWYMDAYMGGGTYNPWADYDHDGISNYGEFLAGTIPFDETARLSSSMSEATSTPFPRRTRSRSPDGPGSACARTSRALNSTRSWPTARMAPSARRRYS